MGCRCEYGLDERWARATALWARVGPRTRDIAFILVGLIVSANQVFVPRMSGGLVPSDSWYGIIAVLAGTICLWWRRTYPALVTIVGIAIIVLTTIYIFLLIGLFSFAIHRRDRALVALTILGFGAAIFGTAQPDRFSAGSIVGAAFIVLLAVLAGAYIGVRRDLLVSLRDQVAQAEAERDLRAAQARIGERSRIAREMHDVLAHKVSLIALQAGGLEVNRGAGPHEVEESARLIGTTARRALEDLRGVLGVLRADESPDGAVNTVQADLAPQPSLSDLPALVESSRDAGVRVELTIADIDVPEVLGRTTYRIVQEALTNVHKHARGASTKVSVTGTEGETVVVEVANLAPVGSDSLLPGSGAGLVGIRERVELLGGQFSSGTTPDRGWRVTASLPWPRASAPSEVVP